MDLLSLSCSSLPCHSSSSLKWGQSQQSSDFRLSKLILHKKAGVSCVRARPRWGFRNKSTSKTRTRICCSYVVEGDMDLAGVSKRERVLPKVLVPSLPNEPNGNRKSPITSCYWEWKPKFKVHYEMAGMENTASPALLFLPGFGVGSFHYEKQLKDLGRQYRVWALDFLGQGKSLASENPTVSIKVEGSAEEEEGLWGFGEQTEPWAEELVYSVDLWRDQVQNFVEQVVGEPVYIVGNSLGGFVSLYFAACNADMVKGVTLLNATPFWGFLPNPTRSPGFAKLFPWAGTFPLPTNVKKLTELVWEKISEPSSIHEILKQVYADHHTTKVDKVFDSIIEVTRHPAAPASFASIMLAPRAKLSFQESLTRCRLQNVPICLMYGKEDPWVKTFWGLKVKEELPEAPYYEISPAGHCPHDEVPEVINYLLRGWIKNIESQGLYSLPLFEGSEPINYDIERDVEFVRNGSKKSVRVHMFGSKFSIWNYLSSSLKSQVLKFKPQVFR